MNQSTYEQKKQLVNVVFTPSVPISTKDSFFGRAYQISRIAESIKEQGKHIVIYGERGVGKTSLANLVEMGMGVLSGKITCETDDYFQLLWERMLQKLKIPLQQSDVPYQEDVELPLLESGFYDTNEKIRPSSLVNGFEGIKIPLILIFDEFDRVNDEETKRLFRTL